MIKCIFISAGYNYCLWLLLILCIIAFYVILLFDELDAGNKHISIAEVELCWFSLLLLLEENIESLF